MEGVRYASRRMLDKQKQTSGSVKRGRRRGRARVSTRILRRRQTPQISAPSQPQTLDSLTPFSFWTLFTPLVSQFSQFPSLQVFSWSFPSFPLHTVGSRNSSQTRIWPMYVVWLGSTAFVSQPGSHMPVTCMPRDRRIGLDVVCCCCSQIIVVGYHLPVSERLHYCS